MLIAALLPAFAIFAAIAINIAYMSLARTELRVSTDAASRAGARMLVVAGSKDQAKIFARDAANRNLVAGQPLQLSDSDFEFGRSERSSQNAKYIFTRDESLPNPNAMRLDGRRVQGSASGPITLFMPRITDIGIFEPTHSAVSTQLELDLALVIDRSGSMAFADDEVAQVGVLPAAAPAGWGFGQPIPPNSRWQDAINGVNIFLGALSQTPQSEHVALVTYQSSATRDVELTSNHASVLNALTGYSAAFNGGGTNIGSGIDSGLATFTTGFERSWAIKVIVLLTDGIHYTGTNPVSAANRARDNSVVIYTVTFSEEADQAKMQTVADRTGGLHYHANTGTELMSAFQAIANRLPTLLTE